MWTIRPERQDDAPSVDALVDLSFGPGRYAKSAYRLREGVNPLPELSFVAQTDGNTALLGSVRFWPFFIDAWPALLLGPLAVKPSLRGRGVGIALMKRGIDEARGLGHAAILLIGDEPYYARVGFARLMPGQVRFPGPVNDERVLGIALVPGALASVAGQARRAWPDHGVAAQGADVGPSNAPPAAMRMR